MAARAEARRIRAGELQHRSDERAAVRGRAGKYEEEAQIGSERQAANGERRRAQKLAGVLDGRSADRDLEQAPERARGHVRPAAPPALLLPVGRRREGDGLFPGKHAVLRGASSAHREHRGSGASAEPDLLSLVREFVLVDERESAEGPALESA
jgi:hypothetical protein